ncbi:HD domain-containing phosphohydrolase [Vibrio sp. HN007]|uniref:HD domain-containing phosphohydrolase n=1 Tax=Vibrio iocasae TaxID=3098914 RepID=UPI0035D3F015
MHATLKQGTVNRLSVLVFILWTLIISLFAATLFWQSHNSAQELALNEARAGIRKDMAYRQWGASHGGVYVPVTEKTPPNPYLSDVMNRDVTTDDGQKLTLMNPAYMLSQVTEDYSKAYGVKGNLTSLNPINPNNVPSQWESEALAELEKTRTEYLDFREIDGKNYALLMQPMITKSACLKCHAKQGYQLGDIRGGLSIAIPMEGFYAQAFNQQRIAGVLLMFFWVLGSGIIYHYRKRVVEYFDERQQNLTQYVYSLVEMIEGRDSYTAGHTKRVAEYSTLIAREMGLTEDEIERLQRAAMVHDIGKISTPDAILLKPGDLSDLEYNIIKQHVIYGYELLKKVDLFQDIAAIVKCHHERHDGKGYPSALKGREIPLLAQILSVADSFDAMTTDRIYKTKKTVAETLNELDNLSGSQFNPEIIPAARKALSTVQLDGSRQLPNNAIEQKRFAYFYSDPLTGLYNLRYLKLVLAARDNANLCPENAQCKYATIILTRNFSNLNKNLGWAGGSKVLVELAEFLSEHASGNPLFRVHGDDFVILSGEPLDREWLTTQLNNRFSDHQLLFRVEHKQLEKEGIKSIDEFEQHLYSYAK